MHAAALPAKPFRRADGSPRRVLYAEDQTSSRVVTTAMLKRMGFEVDAVEDGELALQYARHETYDVILLDIEMPVMDGVTAARSIREQLSHCNDTPILAMSAFLADSTEATLWRSAFDSTLPKPANTNELATALSSALGMKDRNVARGLQKTQWPEASEILHALRNSMSMGAWRRLKATAVQEMNHLALAMSAAVEAHDVHLLRKCSQNLRGLALNFGGLGIVAAADAYLEDTEDKNWCALLAAIAAWDAA